jgi:hypothetical protein
VHCVVRPHEVPLLRAAVLADFESQQVFDHPLDDGVSGVCVVAALPERFTNSCEWPLRFIFRSASPCP